MTNEKLIIAGEHLAAALVSDAERITKMVDALKNGVLPAHERTLLECDIKDWSEAYEWLNDV